MAINKSLIQNPALAYMTAPEEELGAPDGSRPTRPERRKAPESKSRRVQLLIKPSIYDKVKEIADVNGWSFNEACNIALNEFIQLEEAHKENLQ